MVSSAANSVHQYLEQLPQPRRGELEQLVELIRANLPQGHDEAMAFGMIAWQVPIEISGPTYNKQPLCPVALAAQKHHISLYLLSIYGSEELTKEFQERWKASGKKLDMGKSCIRFRSLDQADLETIAWAVGLLTPEQFTEMYLKARSDYQASKTRR